MFEEVFVEFGVEILMVDDLVLFESDLKRLVWMFKLFDVGDWCVVSYDEFLECLLLSDFCFWLLDCF